MTVTNSNLFDFATVADLGDEYVFQSDSQDVEFVREYAGIDNSYQHNDSYFVLYGDAEIVEVWGMSGIVPALTKTVQRLA